MSGWNPRYVLYAQAHGRSPEDMLAHDELAWPGGRMAGYVLWIGAQWNRWHCERGLRRFGHVLSDADHADFDRSLEQQRTEVQT